VESVGDRVYLEEGMLKNPFWGPSITHQEKKRAKYHEKRKEEENNNQLNYRFSGVLV